MAPGDVQYRELLDDLGIAAYRLAPDGRLLTANLSFAALLGFPSVADARLRFRALPEELGEECEWRRADGSAIRLRNARQTVHSDDGEVAWFEGVVQPVAPTSAYAAVEARLRAVLPGAAAAVWIDLTHFHDISDTLGHRVGEQLLAEVEKRVAAELPAGAALARTGAGQFAIVLPGADAESARRTADAVIRSVDTTFTLNGIELFLSATAGIAVYPEHGRTAAELLRNADTALFQARSEGRGASAVYDSGAGAAARARLELAGDLRRALGAGELEIFYQPQVDFDGELWGMEALLRWRHPRRGLLLPGEFIALAEETGLVVPIGAWVMEEACRTGARWNSGRHHPVKVCVNVSALQFRSAGLTDVVRRALSASGLPPGLLELELTESLLVCDKGRCSADLAALRALGVSVAIDDFGTGYSCLSYLEDLPVDVVKIDRSFWRDVRPGVLSPVLGAITSMARSLGLRIVAEGIERPDQMEAARELSVDLLQGFLIGRPKPVTDLV